MIDRDDESDAGRAAMVERRSRSIWNTSVQGPRHARSGMAFDRIIYIYALLFRQDREMRKTGPRE
jgi:hypothetical protein